MLSLSRDRTAHKFGVFLSANIRGLGLLRPRQNNGVEASKEGWNDCLVQTLSHQQQKAALAT